MDLKNLFKTRTRAAKRQAKRTAEKTGFTDEQVAYTEMLGENGDKANEIATEFYKKLAELGFTINAWIERSDSGSIAKVRVWPMSLREYKEFKEEMSVEEVEGMAAPVEPCGPGEAELTPPPEAEQGIADKPQA